MKRNSTTLFLESPGATTPIPWVDNSPDFNQFSEPTLSVLVHTWNDFLDSGEELEIIPDPELIVEQPAPNWDTLYGQLMSSQPYQFVLLTSLSIPNLASALGVVIDSIQYGIIKPDSQSALPAFQSAINVLLMVMNNVQQTFSVEQLADIREILDNNGFDVIQLQ